MNAQANSDTERFQISFLGASGTVTGSRYLVEAGAGRVLVDCGLFQGYKQLRLRNWAPFPVDPASIDAVVLTHAHLDHSGYLPRLVRLGFHGKIWCTDATRSLCRIMLPDSGRLLEEEAEYATRKGTSRHRPAEPLYRESDALECLRSFHDVPFGQVFEPVPGLRTSFRLQGHILGAASVCCEFNGARLTFSGDLGRPEDPVMLVPEPPPESDWIVCESTYGNRNHPVATLREELLAVLPRVIERGGVVIIPSFAVGRAQLILHVIAQLQSEGLLAVVPVYLNSPMATDVTDLYRQFPHLHRMDQAALDQMRSVVRIVNTVLESKALNSRKGPMIIVSASGMVTGGRVLHHLIAFASDPRNAIVLCGYQAGGTRGAALAAGASSIRIYGQDVSVKAEVVQLASGSAHADADEILAWLGSAPRPPSTVFVTHGEPDAADVLRARIKRELDWFAYVPEHLEKVELRRGQSADDQLTQIMPVR